MSVVASENVVGPVGSRFLELADVVPVKVCVVDTNGTFRFVNQKLLDWLKMSRAQVIGSNGFDVLPVVDHESQTERLARITDVITTGEVCHYNTVVRHPDKSLRHLECKLLRDDSEDAVLCFFRDITNERESELMAAKYQAIVDTAGEGVILMDEVGIVQAFNKAAESLFGYMADEVIGQNITMLMPAKYAEKHDGYLKRYLDTREPRIIGKAGVQAECLRKDGTIFPADLAVATFEENGKVHFTGVVRDITVQRQFEEHLSAENLKKTRALTQIFNLSGDILGLVDFDGRFQSISPSAEKLIGVPVTGSCGSFIDYVHPDDREALTEAYEQALKGVPIQSHTLRVVNRFDGSVSWTSWSAQPVPEDRVIIVVGRDITEEKLREDKLRQVQKMEAIGQLTGGIAHDFNNLLAAISGSVDLLAKHIEQGKLDRVSRYLDAASQATGRAAQLTQRLLAFARRQPLAPVPVNVNDLVTSMRDIYDRSIGPSISLHTRLATDLWPTICDHNQLENSILNCVINARDAVIDNGIITISTKNVSENTCRAHDIPVGDYVLISVSDNGAGMTDTVKDRAFDPFFTTKPIGQGTGLGLSMLYGFVNQSNGHVKIDSSVGKGTVIRIYLPKANVAAIPVSVVDSAVMPRLAEPGQTVMIVEDEELVRGVLVEIMESSGFATIQASDSTQAIPILNSDQRIDLLLSDVGLPGMNGRQLAEVARQHRPDLKVLFVTGFAPSATLRDTFLEKGMDMMTKPFKVDAVAERVATMLRT